MLKTLFAVTRASSERVSPMLKVRESEAFAWTIPGPSMDPCDAVPYAPAGGERNAEVLNQLFTVPGPLIGCVKSRSGRSVKVPAPAAEAWLEETIGVR